MSTFYGKIKNVPPTGFTFDKIYHNRVEMENKSSTDGIFNSRYVLIDYGTPLYIDYTKVVVDETTFNGNETRYYTLNIIGSPPINTYNDFTVEATNCKDGDRYNSNTAYYVKGRSLLSLINFNKECEYAKNLDIDLNKYKDSYQHTVWQKIWNQTGSMQTVQEKYICVGKLDAEPPKFDILIEPPSDLNQIYYKLCSSDMNIEGYITEQQFNNSTNLYIKKETDEYELAEIYIPGIQYYKAGGIDQISGEITSYELMDMPNPKWSDGRISQQYFNNNSNNLYVKSNSGYVQAITYDFSNKYYIQYEIGAGPYFDALRCQDQSYLLHIPREWKFDRETVFDYNADGFNPQYQHIIEQENQITIEIKDPETDYPVKIDGIDQAANYDINNQLVLGKASDTKQFNIQLQEIGNVLSQFWDMIYPLYKDEEETKRLGKENFEDNERHIFIGNDRDPYSNKYPQTLAEVIRQTFDLLGLMGDNQAYNPLISPTVYSLLNGAASIYGKDTDKISGSLVLVPTDIDGNADGLISENRFNVLKNNPLYYIDEDGNIILVNEDGYSSKRSYYMTMPPEYQPISSDINKDDGIISEDLYNLINNNPESKLYPIYIFDEDSLTFIESNGYNENVKYYSKFVTLKAYLNDLAEKFPLYQVNWKNNASDSIGYIKNRPTEITVDIKEIPTDTNSINYLWNHYV